MTAIRERPILFTGPMVKAILEGRKTQTRRIVRADCQGYEKLTIDGQGILRHGRWQDQAWTKGGRWVLCPYGKPGDKLWVREGHRIASINHSIPGAQFWTMQFREGFGVLPHPQPDRSLFEPLAAKVELEAGETGNSFGPWRSSIHLPRWASRITLEITDVRVQRLQDISEEDAIAEGAGFGFQMNAGWPDYQHIEANGHCSLTQDTAQMSFATLWDSINGKRGPWNSNPWVWVIEFQRLEAQP